MLAVLSQSDVSIQDIIRDLKAVSDWLKEQKGFGLLMGESTRMMYAAIVVSQSYSEDRNAETSVAGSVITAMLAEQVAMAACVGSISSAIASGRSNN